MLCQIKVSRKSMQPLDMNVEPVAYYKIKSVVCRVHFCLVSLRHFILFVFDGMTKSSRKISGDSNRLLDMSS